MIDLTEADADSNENSYSDLNSNLSHSNSSSSSHTNDTTHTARHTAHSSSSLRAVGESPIPGPDLGSGTVGRGYSPLSMNLPQCFWALLLEKSTTLQDLSEFDSELYQVSIVRLSVSVLVCVCLFFLILCVLYNFGLGFGLGFTSSTIMDAFNFFLI
jgi:hypothetical protein